MVKTGFGGSERNAERPCDLRHRHPEQVVQRDDRSMAGVESPQRVVQGLAVGEPAGQICCRGTVEWTHFDFDWPSSTATEDIEAGVDGQPMQPRIESIRVVQPGQVSPRVDEGVLDRVVGEFLIPKNEAGGGVEPGNGEVDEDREGIMVAFARPFDVGPLVHGSLDSARP